MTTITASTTLGVVLKPVTDTNPVVIDAGVVILNYVGNDAVAVSGSADFFTLQNHGVISDSSSATGVGVYLAPGGAVTNAAAASIFGGYQGVDIAGGAGTVVNDGAIVASDPVSFAVNLRLGGSVTNGASASITGALFGIRILGAAGTVVNHGGIASTDTASAGVYFAAGGSATNAAAASITGYDGVVFFHAAGTVVNDGSITGTGTTASPIAGNGVLFLVGGSVTNAAAASITGAQFGVQVGGSGTVVNDGTIAATGTNGYGVKLDAGGLVSNAASGTITSGGNGVDLLGGGTLANAGDIVGNSGTAVYFGGTGASLLVLHPGYRFSGDVIGAASASNTLELASAATVGTVAGLGTKITNFDRIVFDAKADWSIAGNQAGLAGDISGFAPGDSIGLTGFSATKFDFTGGTLTLQQPMGKFFLSDTLVLPGTFTTASFHVAHTLTETEVTLIPPCFGAGTRLLTASGELPVEHLRIGDLLPTVGGRLVPIAWIGHRHVECASHPNPQAVWPVRVQAGAFTTGTPLRDLLLSPDHAVFSGGGLIPVRHLVNGRTIVREPVAELTYYHVELSSHDVILAEGLPCESYLDTGNRDGFADRDAHRRLSGPTVTQLQHARARR